MGRHFSFLLPKQTGGTAQIILIFKTLRLIGRPTLYTSLFYSEGWNDDRLKWDKSQYGGVESVHLAPEKVWKGDIRAFNSISHEDYEATNVIVHSDGRIFWVPPITFHTSCDFGMFL